LTLVVVFALFRWFYLVCYVAVTVRSGPSVVGTTVVAVVVLAAVVLGGGLAWSAWSSDGTAPRERPPGNPRQAGRAGGTGGATTTTAPAPLGPPSQADLDGFEVGLQPVIEIEHPTAIVEQPGTGDLYVTSVAGRIMRIPADGGDSEMVADISDRISTRGESGLLDIAFDATGDLLYVSLVEDNGDVALWEVPVVDGELAIDTPRPLLAVPSPSDVHNAGDIEVDADGLLWFSIGDGGPSQGRSTRAQDLTSLRGKILRIDPLPTADAAYQIPPGNPFAGRADARPEIWVYGLRNPWRFDLDEVTGDLWIGDVGRNAAEEVNHLPGPLAGAGVNLGWPHAEGTDVRSSAPPDLVGPVIAYPHDGRCGVTAGGVYRGEDIPALAGAFLYSDLCDGRVRAVSVSGGQVTAERAFDAEAGYPVSFGTDLAGEMYICSFDANAVYRIVPA
jgi:glucose/arabinose dehydrogenase